jgi:hypothetical protein
MRLITLLPFLCCTAVCGEISPGFYSGKSDIQRVFDAEHKADRVVWFRANLQCDLGLGELRNGARTPLYLSRDKVEHFLKTERHRDFLVVWCDKTIMWSASKDKLTSEVKSFVSRLGYRRVLMLGAHSMGVHVLSDTEGTRAKPDGAANRSQPVGQETNRTSAAAGSGG